MRVLAFLGDLRPKTRPIQSLGSFAGTVWQRPDRRAAIAAYRSRSNWVSSLEGEVRLHVVHRAKVVVLNLA